MGRSGKRKKEERCEEKGGMEKTRITFTKSALTAVVMRA